MSHSKTKKILFLMSGSIAAFKACSVISALVKLGHQVQVVATPSILHFIGPATIEGLTGRPLLHSPFQEGHAMDHIHLERWADLIILCPATANILNKMHHGIGDDLVSTIYLAHNFTKPFLVAPAMNTSMYNHPSTQSSIKALTNLGLILIDSCSGQLACGEKGPGRLAEVDQILNAIQLKLEAGTHTCPLNNPMSARGSIHNKRILITSGGTQEPIDSMRVLSNLSTGKTGADLADGLQRLGYSVDYLGAQNAIQPQFANLKLSFRTFNDLNLQLQKLLSSNHYDGVIHAAAVSDFHIESIKSENCELKSGGTHKLPSTSNLIIELKPNFKILPRLKSYSKNSEVKIVGFKFTATDSETQRKSAAKKLLTDDSVELVIHNDFADIDHSKHIHRFRAFTPTQETPIENKSDLVAFLDSFFTTPSLQKQNEVYL